MAIVPDLNGTPPGRPGNVPAYDPHNESSLEKAFNNDIVSLDVSIAALVAGNQTILLANPLRRAITIINPAGNTDAAIGLTPLTSANSRGAQPLPAGQSRSLKGVICAQAIYCWGTAGQSLTVLVG